MEVFVPFLGDLFSMRETRMTLHISGKKFSSPFLGTCFQYIIFADDWEIYEEFSSPLHLSTKIRHETKKIRHKN